jgi:hypothetical protein
MAPFARRESEPTEADIAGAKVSLPNKPEINGHCFSIDMSHPEV